MILRSQLPQSSISPQICQRGERRPLLAASDHCHPTREGIGPLVARSCRRTRPHRCRRSGCVRAAGADRPDCLARSAHCGGHDRAEDVIGNGVGDEGRHRRHRTAATMTSSTTVIAAIANSRAAMQAASGGEGGDGTTRSEFRTASMRVRGFVGVITAPPTAQDARGGRAYHDVAGVHTNWTQLAPNGSTGNRYSYRSAAALGLLAAGLTICLARRLDRRPADADSRSSVLTSSNSGGAHHSFVGAGGTPSAIPRPEQWGCRGTQPGRHLRLVGRIATGPAGSSGPVGHRLGPTWAL